MKKIMLVVCAISSGFLLDSCNGDDDLNEESGNDCDKEIIIDGELYDTAADDAVTINSATMRGDCLLINYSASGCSGDDWQVELIDSQFVISGNNRKRLMRLSLENSEICEAYLTKETSFYVRNLKRDDEKIILVLTNTNEEILFEN